MKEWIGLERFKEMEYCEEKVRGKVIMAYKTGQEEFWSGEFGETYINRNGSGRWLACNIALFAEILGMTREVKNVIEFGSNIGLNLKAMKTLVPGLTCSAIEINHKAAEVLRKDPFLGGEVEVFEKSILEYEPKKQYDFTLIKGVLIHINPEELERVYQKLYQSSSRYICMVEYYNPTPVMVLYHGNENRLFKRDFAGEFMAYYPDVKLIDYGFQYHGDFHFPQDDTTWFLMEKTK